MLYKSIYYLDKYTYVHILISISKVLTVSLSRRFLFSSLRSCEDLLWDILPESVWGRMEKLCRRFTPGHQFSSQKPTPPFEESLIYLYHFILPEEGITFYQWCSFRTQLSTKNIGSHLPYTRVIFIRNFFISNQAEILQIYYRVTSLLLLKELRLAENPTPYKKNSSVDSGVPY